MATRRESNPLYKLIVLGDGGVGKTALTIQLCLNHFVETYDPTIEDSYRKQVVIDDQVATLEILDTAGQEEYSSLRDQWMRDGEGFILVYSITSRSSFTRIMSYYSQIERVKEGEPFSTIIVANKLDRTSERVISTEEGQTLAKELGGVPFFEVSAKLNVNIESAFLDCARICRQIRAKADNPDQDISTVTPQPKRNGSTSAAVGAGAAAGTVNGGNAANGSHKAPRTSVRNASVSAGSVRSGGGNYGPRDNKKKSKKCILM